MEPPHGAPPWSPPPWSPPSDPLLVFGSLLQLIEAKRLDAIDLSVLDHSSKQGAAGDPSSSASAAGGTAAGAPPEPPPTRQLVIAEDPAELAVRAFNRRYGPPGASPEATSTAANGGAGGGAEPPEVITGTGTGPERTASKRQPKQQRQQQQQQQQQKQPTDLFSGLPPQPVAQMGGPPMGPAGGAAGGGSAGAGSAGAGSAGPAAAAATTASGSSADTGMGGAIDELTLSDWRQLLQGAEYLELYRGEAIVREGAGLKALYQLVEGTATVERKVKGRPHAVVVARKEGGDLFGERSVLVGGRASASVIVSSETAYVLRLKGSRLHKLLSSSPELSAKFYFFLAVDQARRLQAATDAAPGEREMVVRDTTSAAPTTSECTRMG